MDEENLPNVDYPAIIENLKEKNSDLNMQIQEIESYPTVDYDYIIQGLKIQIEKQQNEIETLKSINQNQQMEIVSLRKKVEENENELEKYRKIEVPVMKPKIYEKNILVAAEKGYLSSIKYTLQKDPSRIDDTTFFTKHSALYYSLIQHHKDISFYLHEKGCQISSDDLNDLFFNIGCNQGDLKVLEIIVELFPNLLNATIQGKSGFFFSIKSKQFSAGRFLYNKGCRLDDSSFELTEYFDLDQIYFLRSFTNNDFDGKNMKISLIAGRPCTGKTALVDKIQDLDNKDQQPTMGPICYHFFISHNGKDYVLHLWDTNSLDITRDIQSIHIRGSHGIFLCYDITDRFSFTELEIMLEIAHKSGGPKCFIVLIGTKADLQDSRQVSFDEAVIFAEKHGLFYFETSSYTGSAVQDSVEVMIEGIIEKQTIHKHPYGS